MYCGVPFQSHTHTHTPRSSRLVHAVSVCFIVDLAGRQSGPPATAQGTVCTVNLAPVFFVFFSFLCCLFSNYCLTAAVVVAVLLVFILLGLLRPHVLEFGWKCIAVRD